MEQSKISLEGYLLFSAQKRETLRVGNDNSIWSIYLGIRLLFSKRLSNLASNQISILETLITAGS
jgi:hypothetical protein